MLDFQQKWKVKIWMYSVWVRWVLVGVVLYSIFSVYTVYQKKLESERGVRDVQNKLRELDAKHTVLIGDIDNLQTEEGLEAEIRNKYSVAKEQENVVVLVENETGSSSSQKEPSQSMWQKIKVFLGL